MINIGIKDKNRREVAQKLQIILANEVVLYIKTLKFHWNVHGKHFNTLHLFFKDLYEKLLDISDDVAERIRALDVMSYGTMAEFLAHTSIKEEPGKNPDDLTMIAILLDGHEILIRIIREEIDPVMKLGDAGTNNFLCDLIEKHEKIAWMLRAHLVKK